MKESFSVTRRFFDDKNYPRGLGRHGDFTIKEAEILGKYGEALKELSSGKRKPTTKEEKNFVACCKNKRDPETLIEKVWHKYQLKTSSNRRVYTLSGGMENVSEDFTNND